MLDVDNAQVYRYFRSVIFNKWLLFVIEDDPFKFLCLFMVLRRNY